MDTADTNEGHIDVVHNQTISMKTQDQESNIQVRSRHWRQAFYQWSPTWPTDSAGSRQ
jgi:hypothetical protein